MYTAGIGEESRFYRSHPLLNFTYFVFVIGIIMFANHPIFLMESFAMAWMYSILLCGKKAIVFNSIFTAMALILVPLLNILNVHNGVTVLFYLNGNRVTLEALLYGFAAALMISGMLIWFSCFQVIVTGEKIVYLFGRAAPVIALTLSMAFRFIPLFRKRFAEISAGQRCMGREWKGASPLTAARQLAKEVSILIAWSLEASIETADSMEARGYGLRGRTSFHLYKLTREDMVLWTAMMCLGLGSVFFCGRGGMTIYYYPAIIIPRFGTSYLINLILYFCLLAMPAAMDLKGLKQWKQSSSRT